MAYTKYKVGSKVAEVLRQQAGYYIRDLRLAANLSQGQLADKLGITHASFISQVEAGRGRVPPENLDLWADALEVDVKKFTLKMLQYYDPYTYHWIEGSGKDFKERINELLNFMKEHAHP